ncbi:MAG: tetratricopeptide repeat protein, partial [Chitinophagales bacterium]|nr:tetratricopeptide repeat protein [Chitinophagales bacterium]
MRICFKILLCLALLACGNKIEDKNKNENGGPASEYGIDELIENDPDNNELYFKRANQSYQSGNFEGALSDLEKAMRLDSTVEDYYFLLADVFTESGNLTNARLTTDAAMIKFPYNADFPLKAAKIEIYRRNYEEGIKLLDNVLKLEISYPEAYFWKGILFKEIGDTNKSISNFQTTVEQDPDFYDAYMQLGLLHSAKKNNFALSYFDNARKVRPEKLEPVYFKGVYYQKIGENKMAVKTFKEVVGEDPQNAKAHFKIGINYYQMDSIEKAY